MSYKQIVGAWAVRNGFAYRERTDVVRRLRGWPFDRRGVTEYGLLVGMVAARPALVLHFASTDDSRDCAAVVVELPRPVPSLLVSPRALAELPGDGIELESEEFNAAFQVFSDQPRFAYDVLNPLMMRFLLDSGHRRLRLDGTVLVVWEEGGRAGTGDFDGLTGFARGLYGRFPSFLFAGDYGPPGMNTLRVSELGDTDLGEPAVDVPRSLRVLGYGGRYVEIEATPRRNPDGRSLGHEVAACVVVEAGWPAFGLADGRATSPDQDFRALVLADIGDWWAEDWRSGRCGLRLEWLADRRQGRISAFARGRADDTALAELLCEVACDVADRLSCEVYSCRGTDEPVLPVPPLPEERVDRVREVSVSVSVDATWPKCELTPYALLREYGIARADRPAAPPSGFELMDVMFESRCADERFRRLVLADLADWLPVDERTWTVAIHLAGGQLTVLTRGRTTEERLSEVLREVRSRLSDAVLAYRT